MKMRHGSFPGVSIDVPEDSVDHYKARGFVEAADSEKPAQRRRRSTKAKSDEE